MTSSTKINAAFAELSPEQRQALFDKLRQRKLSHARRPVAEDSASHNPDSTLSPAQAACAALITPATRNRVLELVLEGPLSTPALHAAARQLGELHDSLTVRFDHERQHFVRHDTPLTLHEATADLAPLTSLREQLATDTSTGLQLACLQNDQHTCHLLLAAHPLLLDADALLQLATQLLALAGGSITPAAIKPATTANMNQFAAWSAQLLEQKLLGQEWARLQPKSLEEISRNKPQPGVAPRLQSLFLPSEFIQSRLASGESVKNWFCDALHRCLTSWLSHQEILYWFSAPQLRDEQFETLTGFFPYFVPVTSAGDHDSLPFSQRLSRLHTRFASVSEHLSLELCRKGSNAPLIHYHWFDPGMTDAGIRITSVVHHQPGFLLSPFEIQLTELLDGICLDVHFDPAHVGEDQVNFLLRDLMVYLREERETEGAVRPGLHDRLRQIWKDLLQKNEIGNDQSFFELGGHSLQVTELKFRIRQQLKLDVPISVLYELTTIDKLANFILATHGGSLGWNGSDAANEEEEEEGVL